MLKSPSIVVAGASGYIGKELILRLLEKFPEANIIALSRSQQHSDDQRVQWKACDLFSLQSLEQALPSRIDYAFYLVHSMGPTAHLDQGSFADYDLILADNFSRSLKNKNVKQLIYLGGLIPESKNVSLHLQSRLEVEETFKQYALPSTIFRAGLILGEAGSSFQILIKLVKRLPLMVCPRWTQNLTTPVDLNTVLKSLTIATGDLARVGKTYDLAGCPPLTYMEMMNLTAQHMGLRRLFLRVPFFTPTLSRLWVSLITNSSRDLVYPLIESLEHPMVARDSHVFTEGGPVRSYGELLENACCKAKKGSFFVRFRAKRKTVRSVQRLPLPAGKDAEWIKQQYIEWLPRFLSPLIVVKQKENLIKFSLLGSPISFLELSFSEERSSSDRQLLHVRSGLLAAKNNRGRLEFRVVLNRRFVMAAIHDFQPSLPWYIYQVSQARLHLLVMNAFARHLAKF
ncbi:MAG: hypothetical protein RJB66_197 [Pseudomonadota bacterium]|jgi:uncharacterized protein YbjT (DUF2867 family)